MHAAQLPSEVLQQASMLWHDGVYLVPIRHHSPACSVALGALLAEIKPEYLLIEGPDSMNALLPLLLDPATRPPVAVFQLDDDSTTTQQWFYPLCQYSPEWQAIQQGAALGATLAFIDAPVTASQSEDSSAHSMLQERYLAHSQWLQRLAEQGYCRDSQELWERWFELRSLAAMQDWRSFFHDLFCWCAMARLDYEPEVLEADASLPRERHMARWIAHYRNKATGPVVVLTGGFHTPALINWRQLAKGKAVAPAVSSTQYLIRYGFAQLDQLNSYSAGMPSPAYYQQWWQAYQQGVTDPWLECGQYFLQQLVSQSRQQQLADAISTPALHAAILQAQGLAMLRGHAGPGRLDLLDAVMSCFIKRELYDGYQGFYQDLMLLLRGSALGDVPAAAGSPPLVEDARQQARQHKISLEFSQLRQAELDLYRKPHHLARSRFFHLLDYLKVPLATWQGGPDFCQGTGLELLFEHWQFSWTPQVEARLLELSRFGTTLQNVAQRQLQQEHQALQQQGLARSSAALAPLLTRACVIGLHNAVPVLAASLLQLLPQDAQFVSVVQTAQQLLTLQRARHLLEPPSTVGEVLRISVQSAVHLLDHIGGCTEAEEVNHIKHLLQLHEVVKLGASADQDHLEFWQHLQQQQHAARQRIVQQTTAAPGLRASCACLSYLAGDADPDLLISLLQAHFSPAVASEVSSRWLRGLLLTSPELLVHEPSLLAALDQLLVQLEEMTFLLLLPMWRQAFTRLAPQHTDRLAMLIAQRHGLATSPYQRFADVTEVDMYQGAALQLALQQALQADGLTAWGQQVND